MATEHEVTCVRTIDESETGITHIGTRAGMWTKQQAIDAIESGNARFYTLVQKKVYVRVVPRSGGKYLRTDWDDTTRNNLLDMPRC